MSEILTFFNIHMNLISEWKVFQLQFKKGKRQL